MWDTGSCLLAWTIAERLGLESQATVEPTLKKALNSLAEMPLLVTGLPNKAYHVQTLAMTGYDNKPKPLGIGWSVLDIARAMIGLKAVYDFMPALRPDVDRVMSRWKTSRLLRSGQLTGGRHVRGRVFEPVQEGRIGYEQYAALALMKLGFPAEPAYRSERNLRFVSIHDHQIPDDRRVMERFDAITVTTSDSYLLTAFELGLTDDMEAMTTAILAVQKERFERTGQLTALGEAHIDRKPYFVYNAIVANGRPWGVVNPAGKFFDELRFFNSHIAIGWHMFAPSHHTEKLLSAARGLESDQGWYAGRFETDWTINKARSANVNATVLEAVYYRYYGPILK